MKKIFVLLLVLIPSLTYGQIKREREIAEMHFMDEKYLESFKEYSHLAQFGNSGDLEMLALHYHYGYGIERDINMAKKYYKMAADLDEKLSQAQICEFICDNITNANEKQKADLYKYSRMYSTNFEYSSSTGTTDDIARYALYLCYTNGWGIPANPLLADIWLAFAAYNDSMDAQDEFCSKYGIDGNYDSDEEELALILTYYRHLYDKIFPFIKDDNSIEASFFKSYYLIAQQNPLAAIKAIQQVLALYENPKLSNEGKAYIYDIISQLSEYNIDLKQKYGADAEKYELISDEDKNTWHHIQLTKVIWKVDVMLNKANTPTGISNGHKWVDLGLPSMTKWAQCNIGAENPSDSGSLFAWAESNPKRSYTPNNYNNGETLIMDKKHDTATLLIGDNWSVPSCEAWRELFIYCDIKYDLFKNLITVTSPNKQCITFPLVQNSGKDGVLYWTNTCLRGTDDPEVDCAAALLLDKRIDWGLVHADKWLGCPIRPVYKNQ